MISFSYVGRICVHAHELCMCVHGIYVIHMCVPACVHCVICADIHVCVHVCVYMWRPEINLDIITGTSYLVFWDQDFLLAEKTWLAGQRAPGISLSLLSQW